MGAAKCITMRFATGLLLKGFPSTVRTMSCSRRPALAAASLGITEPMVMAAGCSMFLIARASSSSPVMPSTASQRGRRSKGFSGISVKRSAISSAGR